MELNPVFSAFAHSVKRVHGEFYAVIKLIATPYEFHNKANAGNTVSLAEWTRFIEKVNGYRFAYDYAAGVLTIQVAKKSDTGTLSGKRVCFPNDPDAEVAVPDPSTIPETMQTFNYGSKGIDLSSGNPNFHTSIKSALANIAVNPTQRNLTPPKVVTKGFIQMNDEDGNYDNDTKALRNNIGSKLKSANNYSITPQSGAFDFKNIYATIMNEPFIAERHFGLIRELRVPVEKMTIVDADVKYGIAVKGNLDPDGVSPNDSFVKDLYLLRKKGGKYYNGLAKFFFKIKDDFATVRISFWDLYKQSLNDNGSPHPDGIYVNVTYKTDSTSGLLIDPFATEGIKGYNAIVRTNQLGSDQLFSLSLHGINYTFPHSNDTYPEHYTSGTLNPRTEIVTDQGNARNNVLMAWRGDNLAVNRAGRDKQKGDGMAVRTQAISANNCDNEYIKNNMFIKTESLVNISQTESAVEQAQLRAEQTYYLMLRTVGPTDHCMPVPSELRKRELEFLWTVEDELGVTAIKDCCVSGSETKFTVASPESLPIKKVSIIGNKLYDDNNSGLVDNGNHIVLDEINDEHSERRFIYPPAIKIEDLKFLGYLDVRKVSTQQEVRNKRVVTLEQYKHRFRRIEHRLKSDIPKLVGGHTKINYLPDPRGTQLIFFPADLQTLDRLTVIQHDPLRTVFRYSPNYPFFNKAKSLEFKVKEDRRSNYRIMLDDKPLFRNVRQGIYKFLVYVADEDCDPSAPSLNIYNYNELQVSILDKPVSPSAAGQSLSAIRFNNSKLANYWFSYFHLLESESWNSVKYREQTKLLKLDLHQPEKQYHRLIRKHLPEYELMEGEFPYEVFLTDDGDITAEANLRTAIYPSLVELYIKADPTANIYQGQLFLLRLNDKDVLTAYITSTGLDLKLNDVSIAKDIKISLKIAFNPSTNQFQIDIQGNPAPIPIPNLLKQDISTGGFEVSDEMLYYLQYQPDDVFIRLRRSGEYVFIGNLQHAHSAIKTVKLFGSSPYQGYFPKATSEFELGTDGSTHELFIPNNCVPTKPQIDADVLLMYSKEESWRQIFGVTSKETMTQQLIRLTLSPDFMAEGKNKIGIIISGDPTHSSLVGDDITKLSSTDFSSYSFRDLLPDPADMPQVFSKYIDHEPFINYSIDKNTCEVLQCLPFYNTDLKKWQVILPLKIFKNAEALFVKLFAIKISPGYGLQGNDEQTVFTDTTGTNLSEFSDALTFPVYNFRLFRVSRYDQYYRIEYQGPTAGNKAFFIILTAKEHEFDILYPKDDLAKNKVAFDLWNEPPNKTTTAKNVLLFTGNNVEITRVDCYSILILEFEIHDNVIAPLKTDLSNAPRFVDYSPLFGEVPGIRLINIAEFVV